MSDEYKSKEELLLELQELKQEYESLKFTYQKEVIEIKHTKTVLSESEEQLMNLFINAPVGIFHSLWEGRFLTVNPALANILGYSNSKELISSTNDLSAQIYADPKIRSRILNTLSDTDGWLHYDQIIWRRKDQTLITIDMRIRKVFNIKGNFLYLEGFILDITEMKNAEVALRKSEENYRLLIENSYDIIYILNLEGIFEFVSKAWTLFLGHEVKNVLGKSFQNFVHPEDINICQLWINNLIEKGQRQEGIEYRVKHADGSWLWHTSSAVPIRDISGKIIGFEGIARDITGRKLAEAAYQESEEKLSLFLRYCPNPVYIKDENNRAIILSHHFEKMLGKPLSQLIGKTSEELWPPELAGIMRADDEKVIKDLCTIEREEIFEGRHYYSMKFPIKIPNQLTILGGYTIDITAVKKAESEIQLKNLELSELNISKDKFFSIIAHDLKSPFTGFLGLTKVLSENINNFTLQELKDISMGLQSSAGNLYQLLENLLEWSRMQRGTTEYNPEVCVLSLLLNQNINIVNEVAKQKNIEFVISMPEEIHVIADIPMLNSILRNLISNALKFTHRGGRIEIGTISMNSLNHESSNDLIELYIKDNGIGMDNETLQKLFRIDKNVSRPGTENEPSTGLGLILIKEFIVKMNGQIRVESVVGKGSTFYLTLPNAKYDMNRYLSN